MASSGKKWLIGCGAGCGAFTVIMILILVGGGFLMMRPFNQAVDDQKELQARHGVREDYVPVPDGLTPERIKAFLAVRGELMHKCSRFEEIAASFREMDKLDQGSEEPPLGEVLRGVGNVMGSAFGMAGEIGALVHSRNNELLKNDMGLGEYTWIYVLAYHSWLGYEPNTGVDDGEHAGFTRHELGTIRQLMQNHARALEESGRHAEASLWRDESERLYRTGGGVPFAAGDLPGEITSKLIPFRSRLEATYCPAMSGYELGRVVKKGFSIRSD